MNNHRCPECKSFNVSSFPEKYEDGGFTMRTYITDEVIHGRSNSVRKYAPPRKPEYSSDPHDIAGTAVGCILFYFVLGFIVGGFFIFSFTWDFALYKTVMKCIGVLMSLGFIIYAIRSYKENKKHDEYARKKYEKEMREYEEAKKKWENTYVCNNCGYIFLYK